jgi:hypothetical protein
MVLFDKGDYMKKLYISALLLLAGCVVNNIQAAGKENPRFEKHYEDEVKDNEMTISEYLDAVEKDRANKSGWQTTARMLKTMREGTDFRYAFLEQRLFNIFDDYRQNRINFTECQKKIKDVIGQTYRGQ